MDSAEEKALLERLIAMDPGAWDTFCAAYSRALLAFVHLSVGCSAEQAEEIVQMAFVRCVRSIHTVDVSRGRLMTWLKAVARNEAHTLLRRDGRTAALTGLGPVSPTVADEILAILDGQPLPEEVLAGQDLREATRNVLLGLKPRYREVLLAKYVDEMSVADIAADMGLSLKAAESLLSRAREAFRAAIGARGMREIEAHREFR